MADHEHDQWIEGQKLQDAALAFYGDGTQLKEVYGRVGETYDQAAAKFYGSHKVVSSAEKTKVKLSYEEAKRAAYGH